MSFIGCVLLVAGVFEPNFWHGIAYLALGIACLGIDRVTKRD